LPPTFSGAGNPNLSIESRGSRMAEEALPNSSVPNSNRKRLNLGIVLFLICLGFYLYAVSLGWNEPILDMHGFRQTQTAISAYYMIGKMPKLAYETPMMGPPWSIPYEFPLFQWIVAAIVQLFGTPLDQTGRFVSVCSFLLTFFPAYRILGKLNVSNSCRWIMLALLAVTPEYLFWSRTFMIESHVIFLSMCYLAFALDFLDNPRPIYGIAGVGFGCLAALVKITTFSIFLGAVLLVYGFRCARMLYSPETRRKWLYHAGVIVLLLAAPVLVSSRWTSFTARQEELRSFGGKYLTSSNLTVWHFGTLQDRMDLKKWETIQLLAGFGANLYAPVVCFAGFFLASAAWLLGRRFGKEQLFKAEQLRLRWLALIACILLYLSGPLVFFNLYYIHNYYWCANTVFLVAAMGICVVTMMEMGKAGKVAGTAILLLLIAGSIRTYFDYYYDYQTGIFKGFSVNGVTYNDSILEMSRKIEENTRPEEVFVCLGHDWNSDLPYYCKRRTINPPSWIPESLEQQIGEMAKIQDETLGALVIDRLYADKFAPEKILKIMEQNGFETHFLATEGRLELYSLKKIPPSGIKAKRP
jgi:hypothetical protein